MKSTRTEHGTNLWLSAADTYEWANRPGESWPCSQVAGKRLFAAFDSRGDLVDMAINGRVKDIDANEFNAITSDFLKKKYGADHPAIR